MHSLFTPVDPDFYDIISTYQEYGKVVVHYFDPKGEIETARGMIDKLLVEPKKGDFLLFPDKIQVRIDRVITINGRPGPAYGEYELYAIQCHECMGGTE